MRLGSRCSRDSECRATTDERSARAPRPDAAGGDVRRRAVRERRQRSVLHSCRAGPALHGRRATAVASRGSGATPGSVTDVREIAARHRVHDARPPLGAARRPPMRRRPYRAHCTAAFASADGVALAPARARARHVAGNPSHAAPVGRKKNGRRPHRCLQSGRESALRRPQTLRPGLRRRSRRTLR